MVTTCFGYAFGHGFLLCNRNRISGPLIDRIDIHVEAPAVEFKELSSDERAEPSAAIRERAVAALEIQSTQFIGGLTRANAGMAHAQLKTRCKLDPYPPATFPGNPRHLGLSFFAFKEIASDRNGRVDVKS